MNPQPTPHRRRPNLLNSLVCFARYHLRELKYQYYDLVDGAHDAVSANPVAVKQCRLAACGLLGGAVATLAFALVYKRNLARRNHFPFRGEIL